MVKRVKKEGTKQLKSKVNIYTLIQHTLNGVKKKIQWTKYLRRKAIYHKKKNI